MNEINNSADPDLDSPLRLSLTPELVIHALFRTASAVHTGWSSCVEVALVVRDLVGMDESSGNYCRLVEQEFVEDDKEDVVWHDWAVEIRIGDVLTTGHWQLQVTASPLEWEWCAREAEAAFEKGCVLFGKSVRRGIGLEEPDAQTVPPKPKHH